MSGEIERIAASLTEAQRKIVAKFPVELAAHGGGNIFVDYQRAGIRQRRTRAALTNSGVTEPYQRGPVTIFSMVRLTPLGLAVRAKLQETSQP